MPYPLPPVALDTQLASKTNGERLKRPGHPDLDGSTMNDSLPSIVERECSTTTSPAGLCSAHVAGRICFRRRRRRMKSHRSLTHAPAFAEQYRRPALDGLRTRGSSVAQARDPFGEALAYEREAESRLKSSAVSSTMGSEVETARRRNRPS